MSQLPGNYQWMMEHYGEVMRAHQEFGQTLQAAGPLDNKTAELIKLAAAAAIHAEGAVHSHARRAREAGASIEEIQHTLVSLISTIGFPTVAAALSWTREACSGQAAKREPQPEMSEDTRQLIRDAMTKAAPGKRIACARALRMAEEFGQPPAAIGQAANELSIKIAGCQLGCF